MNILPQIPYLSTFRSFKKFPAEHPPRPEKEPGNSYFMMIPDNPAGGSETCPAKYRSIPKSIITLDHTFEGGGQSTPWKTGSSSVHRLTAMISPGRNILFSEKRYSSRTNWIDQDSTVLNGTKHPAHSWLFNYRMNECVTAWKTAKSEALIGDEDRKQSFHPYNNVFYGDIVSSIWVFNYLLMRIWEINILHKCVIPEFSEGCPQNILFMRSLLFFRQFKYYRTWWIYSLLKSVILTALLEGARKLSFFGGF